MKDFWKHNFDNGFLVTAPLLFGKTHYSWRHLVPMFSLSIFIILCLLSFLHPFFQGLLFGLVGFYMMFSLYFSFKTAMRGRRLAYFFIMPLIFGSLHLGYALGSLKGVFKCLLSRMKPARMVTGI